MQLNNIPSSWYGFQYRCAVNGNNNNADTLGFEDYSIGSINTICENPLNRGCGTLPHSNTDVIIDPGTAVLHSNTIRSMTVSPGSFFYN